MRQTVHEEMVDQRLCELAWMMRVVLSHLEAQYVIMIEDSLAHVPHLHPSLACSGGHRAAQTILPDVLVAVKLHRHAVALKDFVDAVEEIRNRDVGANLLRTASCVPHAHAARAHVVDDDGQMVDNPLSGSINQQMSRR